MRLTTKVLSLYFLLMTSFVTAAILTYFAYKISEKERHLAERALAGGSDIRMCQESLSKLKIIPVIGGGYLRSDRAQGLNTYLEDGECGVDSFNARLMWTGSEVVLDTGFEPVKPKREGSSIFNVTVVFSRIRREDPKSTLGESVMNNKELIVNKILPLTNYPGLELRLIETPPSKQNLQRLGTIFSSESDVVKKTRLIICDFSSGRMRGDRESETIFQAMSKLDNKGLQSIDLSRTRAPCTVNFGAVISGRSQGVRVFFGSGDLQVTLPALRAIEKYISDSISEDKK